MSVRDRACRLMLAVAAGSCAADWAVKALDGRVFGEWVQHQITMRPVALVAVWAFAAVTLWLAPGRGAAVGLGLFAGGCSANILDSLDDGQVQNMLDLPLAGAYYVNVADVLIAVGLGVTVVCVALHAACRVDARLRRAPAGR